MVPFQIAILAAAAFATCTAASASPKHETQVTAPVRQGVTLAEIFAADARGEKKKINVDLTVSSDEFFRQADRALNNAAEGKLVVQVEGEKRSFTIKIKGSFSPREVIDEALRQAGANGVELVPPTPDNLVLVRRFGAQSPADTVIKVESPVGGVTAPVAKANAVAIEQPVAPAVIGKAKPAPVAAVAPLATAAGFTFTGEGSYTAVIDSFARQFGLRVAKAAGKEPRKASVFVKTPSFDNIDDLVDYVRKAIEPVELRFNGASKTVQVVFDEKAISKAIEQVQDLISNDAVELNKRYASKKAQATSGEAGIIQYQFGTGEPVIISSPLKVTDISLEPGEKISNIVAGDTARWVISTGNSGQGDIVSHVFVKPSDLGLETTAVVTTDRRTYTMTLRAAAQGHMQRVGFTYPKAMNTAVVDIVAIDAIKKAEKAAAEEERRERERGIDAMDPAGLDFNYKIETTSGNPSFVPTRVFSNTKKTVIQFTNLGGEQAPALFSVADDGSLELLNYRWKGTSIVADEKLRRAALVIGIDDKQQRVDIVLDGTSPARKKLFGLF